MATTRAPAGSAGLTGANGGSRLDALAAANPQLNCFDLADHRLGVYGSPVTLPAELLAQLLAAADAALPTEAGAVSYVPSEPSLEQPAWLALLAASFGHQPIQVGWCASANSTLNGLEYHRSPEVVIAVTDLALLLGRQADISAELSYDSRLVECLFLSRGQAVRLHPETLHFSPCRVDQSMFKSLIVLPAGTNTPLPAPASDAGTRDGHDRLLFMKNKWLLAHPEREPLMKKGAWPGIVGPNIEVKLIINS